MLCSIDGCGRPVRNRGWCNAHYLRWRRHGGPLAGGASRAEATGAPCSVDGCGKPTVARGWCTSHWTRWSRHGDPQGGDTGKGELPRFFREIVLAYDGNNCLPWPFGRHHNGYASMLSEGQTKYVHRLVCEEANGPPPTPKHDAAHSCGRGHEGCVTRRHLRWATRAENEADKIRHGTRIARGRGTTR